MAAQSITIASSSVHAGLQLHCTIRGSDDAEALFEFETHVETGIGGTGGIEVT